MKFPLTPNSSPAPLQAPAEVDFTWSDGHLAVTKKLKFDASYIASVEVHVQLDGRTYPAALAWRGGFGDASAFHAAAQTQVFYNLNGKLELLSPAKLGQPDNPAQRKYSGRSARVYRRGGQFLRHGIFAAAGNIRRARRPVGHSGRLHDAHRLVA